MNVSAFNNLTAERENEIDDIQVDLHRLTERVEALGRHRSYSLAITKLDEARHWLAARKHQAA